MRCPRESPVHGAAGGSDQVLGKRAALPAYSVLSQQHLAAEDQPLDIKPVPML